MRTVAFIFSTSCVFQLVSGQFGSRIFNVITKTTELLTKLLSSVQFQTFSMWFRVTSNLASPNALQTNYEILTALRSYVQFHVFSKWCKARFWFWIENRNTKTNEILIVLLSSVQFQACSMLFRLASDLGVPPDRWATSPLSHLY